MKTPCKNCPFLTSFPAYLRPGRAKQISDSLLNDGFFPCHKTVDYSGDSSGKLTEDSKACMGAVLFLENAVDGGCRSNMMFRLAMRRGDFTEGDLRKSDQVYQSISDFVEAMT
jgi:hypothetical protein